MENVNNSFDIVRNVWSRSLCRVLFVLTGAFVARVFRRYASKIFNNVVRWGLVGSPSLDSFSLKKVKTICDDNSHTCASGSWASGHDRYRWLLQRCAICVYTLEFWCTTACIPRTPSRIHLSSAFHLQPRPQRPACPEELHRIFYQCAFQLPSPWFGSTGHEDHNMRQKSTHSYVRSLLPAMQLNARIREATATSSSGCESKRLFGAV